MDVSNPELEEFRRELINDLETRRLIQLTGGVNLDRDREISEASTATLRAKTSSREQSVMVGGLYEDEEDNDNDKMEIDDISSNRDERGGGNERTLIATDFGTTFSSVAFAIRGRGLRPEIQEISGFPDDPMTLSSTLSVQVPTESWYLEDSDVDGPEFEEVSSRWNLESSDGSNDGSDREDTSAIEHGLLQNAIMETTEGQLRNETPLFLWGYGVHEKAAKPDGERSQYNRVARSKLLLDKTHYTDGVRTELGPVLRRLKRRKLIKKDEDVIADYLTQLFCHTREQLVENYGISTSTTIEHVLCVPVVWKADALRTMQRAMEIATTASGLGNIDNLFLVSEPEAAAAYVLGKDRNQVQPGEAFLILDAGGGTVDATTYKVHKEHPLRLSDELVQPDGCLNGSSFLNEGFRQHLRGRLQGEEQDIEINGYTAEGIVDSQTLYFEQRSKRIIDITNPKMPNVKIQISGIRENSLKRFEKNAVVMKRNDFIEIYEPHFQSIGNLMKRQLSGARVARHQVQKVILIGGFSASVSLRKYLGHELREISKQFGYRVVLTSALAAGEHETAVARGAILRAWDKEDGPTRITQSSFGFGITEEHEPQTHDAHIGVKPRLDPVDGRDYVENAIYWLVVKEQEIPFHAEYSTSVYRIFPATRKFYKVVETLYVSDVCTESHYRRTHEKNKKAALEAGTVEADMTFLVTEGHIQPIQPEEGFLGKPHYKIEFELVIIIHGRNLRYEARWPIGGEARGVGQICIAAAFRPGTN